MAAREGASGHDVGAGQKSSHPAGTFAGAVCPVTITAKEVRARTENYIFSRRSFAMVGREFSIVR